MSTEKHVTPDGVERGLGCLVPQFRPAGFRTFSSAPGMTVLGMDQLRQKVAEGATKNFYNRRVIFGPKWISDQHSTNACNGHSCARALSRGIFVRSGVEVLLSGADAYSQMNDNRDEGSTLSDGLKILQANGVARADLVPWNHIYTRQISAEAKADRLRHKGFELYAVDDEEEFASGLLYGFMGVVAVHVQRGYDQQDGNGVCQGGNGVGNHSVIVDDIGILPDGSLVYDQPNSWSPSWGHQGRTYLTWKRHLAQSVKHHRFFLLRGALDDPQGDNPPPAV